ncbi:S-layer homology domain-containing protein, partial [Desulfurobacterium sp.]|uniref:S-layer homology domain-containing protein n=1 Tax=Desulfurobacterium sp. TaxID=2004706 RepID=UPI0026357943
LALFLIGCSPKVNPTLSLKTNPTVHYVEGMKLIENGKLSAAERRFNLALKADPKFAKGYAGKALVSAIEAGQMEGRHKNVETETALEFFEKAKKFASSPEDEFSVYVTGIRVFYNAEPSDWLDSAENYYEKAIFISKEVKSGKLPYYESLSAAPYFMGVAYLKAYKFKDAETMFSKVLSSPPSKWHKKAEDYYFKVQKLVRASSHYTLTYTAKEIAVKDKVSRVDAVVLLVDELKIDHLFRKKLSTEKLPKPEFIPPDVVNHPLKEEILTVLSWRIRGLQPEYDEKTRAYLFRPDKPLKRKELALILEDILTKISPEKGETTKYFGQQVSPYPDVPPTVPWYNAVVNVVNRGLMDVKLTGEFRPNDDVDGAELLLSILRLRDILKDY